MSWQKQHERSFRGVYEIGGRSFRVFNLFRTVRVIGVEPFGVEINCGFTKEEVTDLRGRAKALGNHYVRVRDMASYEETVRAATDAEPLALILLCQIKRLADDAQ